MHRMSDLEEQYESELESYNYEERNEESDKDLGREMEEYEEPSAEAENKDFELEMEEYEEPTMETDSSTNELAQRFLELQEREFESPGSRNAAIDGMLNEVEKQYFLGKLTGGVVNKVLQKLIGGVIPGNPLKIIKGAVALIRMAAKEPLRGALISAITLHPALAPARPLLKLLGISETAENAENSLDRWNEFVKLSEIMYENIINNMNKAVVNDPVAANQLASKAFANAASHIRNQTAARVHGRRRRRTIFLGPGEYVVVRRKRRH
jgi:hypothetical protein